jgi:pentatricopeptide repeat protein
VIAGMLRLRYAFARLLLQPAPLPLCEARRWLAKDSNSKTPAQSPSSKQQQQPAWRGQARNIKPGLTATRSNTKALPRLHNDLLRHEITALQRAGCWRDVIPAVNAARAAGLVPNVFVYSKIVSILARAKQVELAMQQFEQMQSEGTKPDLVLFNTLLDACAQRGMADKAFDLLKEMTAAGVEPDAISCNSVINACSKAGQHERAIAVLKQMRSVRLKPDVRSYTSAIDACSKAGQYERAVDLLKQMRSVGLTPNERSYTSAIDACARCGQIQLAHDLLLKMIAVGLIPDVISYNAVINACSRSGNVQLAIKLLSDMKGEGLQPDEISYTAVIDACKNTGNWQLVVDLIQQMKAGGLKPNILTYTAAIDALQAGGQYHAADALYADVSSRDLLQHWSTHEPNKGMLDFHEYTTGMTLAAIRLVLRDMCSFAAHSDSEHYVHNPATNLVIITGHASSRQDQDGSILQPCIIEYCTKLGILCQVDFRNKGRLIISAAQLQQYIAQQAA